MHDISTREDIQLLITEFYKKVREDEILAPHFAHIDWDHHTPVIINFWCLLLLGDPQYQGNPFSRHLHLSLNAIEFTTWLKYFHETVDQYFIGEKALEAKQRASNIAAIFQHKLGIEF
jgi:hemoglobin